MSNKKVKDMDDTELLAFMAKKTGKGLGFLALIVGAPLLVSLGITSILANRPSDAGETKSSGQSGGSGGGGE